MKMTRTCRRRGKETKEVVYGITSLSAEEAPPKTLWQLWRSHWGIENRLHYIRDGALREDFCRCRTRPIPQILAAMRSLVIFALRRAGKENITAAIEWFGDNKSRAIDLLFLPRIK